MELRQAIAERRSIRKYKPGMTITKDQLADIISCAGEAPTWKNSQTGRYYVALSEEAMNKVREGLPEFNANNTINACALIITTFEMKRSGFTREGVAENELGDQWGAYDLGLQNENLVLRARDIGYDTLIMGIRDSEILRANFNIPESQQIVSVIAIGVKEDTVPMPKRKEIDSVMKVF